MSVQHIKNMDEFKTLLESPGLVVVDYSASWCGPCKFIGPKFEELAAKGDHPGVVFAKVDVDEAEDVAASQSIQAMPTFKFYKAGAQVAEMMGADLEKLVSLLGEHK